MDDNYNPDKEIMKLISRQIKCTLPWNEIEIEGMKECKSKNDFDNYLKMIFKQQEDIKQVPPKCQFKTWTPMPYSEGSTADEKSSIVIMLRRVPCGCLCHHTAEQVLHLLSNYSWISLKTRAFLRYTHTSHIFFTIPIRNITYNI